MIEHAIVFGPVGALVFWDEHGRHALRWRDDHKLFPCDELASTLMSGNIEGQRLDPAKLSRSSLNSVISYWSANHQALRAVLGAMDETLDLETSKACMRAAEYYFKESASTLHFVTCRMLGCYPPSEGAFERASALDPNRYHRKYAWLIQLIKRTRRTVEEAARRSEDILSSVYALDMDGMRREVIDSGMLAGLVARTAGNYTLDQLLQFHRDDRIYLGCIIEPLEIAPAIAERLSAELGTAQ